MNKFTYIIIGVAIGLALPYLIDYALFRDFTPINITTTYEDGSFTGCIAGGICED